MEADGQLPGVAEIRIQLFEYRRHTGSAEPECLLESGDRHLPAFAVLRLLDAFAVHTELRYGRPSRRRTEQHLRPGIEIHAARRHRAAFHDGVPAQRRVSDGGRGCDLCRHLRAGGAAGGIPRHLYAPHHRTQQQLQEPGVQPDLIGGSSVHLDRGRLVFLPRYAGGTESIQHRLSEPDQSRNRT